MKGYPIKPTLCLKCGYATDMASNVSSKGKPQPGDYTLCLNCGQLMQFNDKLYPVMLGDGKVAELTDQQRRIVEATKAFIRRRGPIPKRGKPN
jgi:hypothetical protein